MSLSYIKTNEDFLKFVKEDLRPYCLNKNNLLAVDLETYLTSLAGSITEEDSSGYEEKQFEHEGLNISDMTPEEVIQNMNAIDLATLPMPKAIKIKESLKESLIPRPIILRDGSYTGSVRTIQLGFDPNNVNSLGGKQFVIDCMYVNKQLIINNLKPLIQTQLTLGHNIKYDYQFLFALFGIELKRMVDTMIVSKALTAGLPFKHGLADLYDRCLDFKWFFDQKRMTFDEYKEFKVRNQKEEDWSKDLSEDQVSYAADDVYLIFYAWERLKEEIRYFVEVHERDIDSANGIKWVIQMECSAIPVFAHMELRGIKLDRDYHEKVVVEHLKEIVRKTEEKIPFVRTTTIKKSNGKRGKDREVWFEVQEERININSHEQLKAALYELLLPYSDSGRMTTKWNKAGTIEKPDKYYLTFESEEILLNTEEKTLKRFTYDEMISPRLPEDVIKTIENVLKVKKAKSLLSKFGMKLIYSCTDRGYIHPSWFQMGTESGRSSCKTPNYQQWPSRGSLKEDDGEEIELGKLFRTSTIADDGWVLIGADYSQIEARYAALVCRVKELIEKFNSNCIRGCGEGCTDEDHKIDIHAEIAKTIMKLSQLPSKKSFERKYIGKTFGFSALFGAYPKKLMVFMRNSTDGLVNWDLKQATEARENFFAGYPEFAEAQAAMEEAISALAREAGSLEPFKMYNKTGRPNPFYVAKTALGKHRPRLFCIPDDYKSLSRYQLSKNYEPTEQERIKYNLRFGNFWSNLLNKAAREAFNHRIQGSAANLLKLAAIKVHKELLKAGLKYDEGIIALVHDEILLHVRKEHEEIAKEILERCMIEANNELAPDIKVEAKAVCGKNWYEAKD